MSEPPKCSVRVSGFLEREREKSYFSGFTECFKCMIITSNEQNKQAFQTAHKQIPPKLTNKSAFETRRLCHLSVFKKTCPSLLC